MTLCCCFSFFGYLAVLIRRNIGGLGAQLLWKDELFTPFCPMTRSLHPPMTACVTESDSRGLGERNFSGALILDARVAEPVDRKTAPANLMDFRSPAFADGTRSAFPPRICRREDYPSIYSMVRT